MTHGPQYPNPDVRGINGELITEGKKKIIKVNPKLIEG